MQSSLIGKIEKAKRYAQEKERITFSELSVKFHGENDDYNISYKDGKWHCSCHFFSSWGHWRESWAICYPRRLWAHNSTPPPESRVPAPPRWRRLCRLPSSLGDYLTSYNSIFCLPRYPAILPYASTYPLWNMFRRWPPSLRWQSLSPTALHKHQDC